MFGFEQIPTIGRIVHYRLTAEEADKINKRVADAQRLMHKHRSQATGVIVHVGNTAYEGDTLPMMIVKTWGDEPGSAVNGQVMLDGNHALWMTSVSVGEGPGTWSWPAKA